MPTYTDSIGYNRGDGGYPAPAGTAFVSKIEVVLDFAKIIAARAAAGATALAAADTIQALRIPANTTLLHAGFRVTKAETTNTTATFDIGFLGGTPAAANVFGNDIASNAIASSNISLTSPITFTVADTIDLLLNTAVPQNAVVRIFAYVLDGN